MTSPDSTEKVALNVQIPDPLKTRLVAYADDRGLSQTASVTVLLDDALNRAGYPRTTR